MRTSLILFLALFVASCSAPYGKRIAKVYSSDFSDVIEVTFYDNWSGHGNIESVLPDGEKFKGEYSTVREGSVEYGFITGGGSFESGIGTSLKTKANGMASLRGDQGTVMSLKYYMDWGTGHGFGEGSDSKGRKYTIQF